MFTEQIKSAGEWPLKLKQATTCNSPWSRRKNLVPGIHALAETLESVGDVDLAERAGHLRQRVTTREDSLREQNLVPAVGLIVEALRRVMGFRLHDVQIEGGIECSRGCVIEMKTGEGKTVVTAISAFVHSLVGRGVHVATTNDYLAQRDFHSIKPALQLLGQSVGILQDDASDHRCKVAYDQDITYGTGYQFGFDYLRDQITRRACPRRQLGDNVVQSIHGVRAESGLVRQRDRYAMILDEADSVMIDEAGLPLILSGSAKGHDGTAAVELANVIAGRLQEGSDFELKADENRIELLEVGVRAIHRFLRRQRVPQIVRPWSTYVKNALHAKKLLRRDEHYVVQNGTVQIVDQNTGRVFPDRKWRDGLHQAVELKERVEVQPSTLSLARITRQSYFRKYELLCGLTGTTIGVERELHHFYDMPVRQVDSHRRCIRQELPTRFFSTLQAKYHGVVEDVRVRHAKGQPVLIGTRTIDQSQEVSRSLGELPHIVLNGLQDEAEANIVAKAGDVGALTVATNMAGRGTDIRLQRGAAKLGGLHVIGTERHLARRIDRQLIGRCARQGDPGSCQFFVSAEDLLVQQYAARLAMRIRNDAEADGESRRDYSQEIERLQRRTEFEMFQSRRAMAVQDEGLNKIRQTLSGVEI